MKNLNFIRYFFFIGFNYGWRIAWFIIKYEVKGEKKYGIDTTGFDHLKTLQKKGMDISHATFYMPVVYPLLEDCLDFIPANNRRHLLDIGCGKGRALSVAAAMHYQQLTGIDISEKLCAEAEKNLQLVQQQYPAITYTIAVLDATSFQVPLTVDCIFLFNPFNGTIMQPVVNNIMQSLQQRPRTIFVIYINPLYKHLFLKEYFEEVFQSKQLQYLDVSILCLKKNALKKPD